jgi:hypothetical protein
VEFRAAGRPRMQVSRKGSWGTILKSHHHHFDTIETALESRAIIMKPIQALLILSSMVFTRSRRAISMSDAHDRYTIL